MQNLAFYDISQASRTARRLCQEENRRSRLDSQEQADSDAEVFSNDLLQQQIRVYAMSQPLPLARYLEQGTRLMMEQQKKMQDQWQQAMRHSPMELMRELAEENMRFWQNTISQGGTSQGGTSQGGTTKDDDERSS